ncbi:MAG: DUF5655 domain-containing protein [Bacteroidota bacterium]|jgi:hypothetical protein
MQPTITNLEEYFNRSIESREIFECICTIIEAMGSVEMRVLESEVAFLRNKAFAYMWMPAKYNQGKAVPLVLTLSLRRRDLSPRWKVVVPLSSGQFTHHLELYSENEVDDQVCSWLQEAWIQAA